MSYRLDMPWRRQDGPGFWVGLFCGGVLMLIVGLACWGCAANDIAGIKATVEATGAKVTADLRQEIHTSTSQAIQATNTVGGNLDQKITTRSSTTTGITGWEIVGLAAVALLGTAAIFYTRSLIVNHGYTAANWAAKRLWGSDDGS